MPKGQGRRLRDRLTDGESERAFDKVHYTLAGIGDGAQNEREGIEDGGEDALDHFHDGLEAMADSGCDTHLVLFCWVWG